MIMGSCITPFTKKNTMKGETIPLPCGKCPECRKRAISAWSFRLMQEDRVSTSSHFITLTYDTANVPISRNGFMELSKRDIQLFFKRLRKALSSGRVAGSEVGHKDHPPLKYFAVGEYGGKTLRPHYHLVLFNVDISFISPAWNLGHVHYGIVSGASVGYTLKYMMKDSKIGKHRNDDRVREFRLMSKGLGERYLTPEMIKWHHEDINNRMYCNLQDGKKIAMPRYYKNKIYTDFERKVAGFHTRIRVVQEEARKEALGKNRSSRDLAEAHIQQFNQMHKTAEEGRYL